jgi:hypothetical protein
MDTWSGNTKRVMVAGLLAWLGLLAGCGTAKLRSRLLAERPVSLERGVVLVRLTDSMEPEACRRFAEALDEELRDCGLDISVYVSGCFNRRFPLSTDSLLARWRGRTVLLLVQEGTIIDGRNDRRGFTMDAYLLDGASGDIVWRAAGQARSTFWKIEDAIDSYVGELFQALVDDGVVTCRSRFRRGPANGGVS